MAELQELLQEKFPGIEVAAMPDGAAVLKVTAETYVPVIQWLKDEQGYSHCSNLTASDHPDKNMLVLVVHLFRVDLEQPQPGVVVKLEGLPRQDAHVPTLTGIWPTANWHERETYDMYGITFDGHPNHRRLLLPDNWQGGHPLLKDFEDKRPKRPRLVRHR